MRFIAFLIALLVGVSHSTAVADSSSFKETRAKAAQGDANAQNTLGEMYEKGKGVTQNNAEAVKWYRKAAEQGNAKAQNNLGIMYNLNPRVTDKGNMPGG